MASDKPNIILITADQLRFDAVGAAAPVWMRTPHYDDLCRQGVEFTRAYADCAVCVPSRMTIMTGQYGFNHGMLWNGSSSEVLDNSRTLPALMKDAGYQTCAVGKMHFTPQRARHGFDEMWLPDDYYREMHRSGSGVQPMRHGLGQNELYPGMATVPESMTLTSWTAEKCLEFVRDRRDPTVPFFLWCSFSKPHPPLDPPEPYYSMYRQCAIPEPVYGDWSEDERCPAACRRFWQSWSLDLTPPEVIREARAAYYGLVTQIDYNIGRVLGALQDVGLLHDALIVFTSDHGEYLGDHHAGSKIFFHEPSAHIPLMVRMPASWDRRCYGKRSSALVTLADVLPTLVTAAGGRTPDEVDGMDLVALARGEIEQRPYLEACAHAPSDVAYTAITDGRWKYIYYPEGPVEQLFDVDEDPHELFDLSGMPQFASRKEELRAEMVQRGRERGSGYVDEGGLISRPMQERPIAEIRTRSWPGYHTDYFDADVRH